MAGIHDFFIVCQPGFEQELCLEIQEFWPFLLAEDARPHSRILQIITVTSGGVLLQAPLMLGLQINFFSRLATRVLLRIAEFRVRDFPKLFERVQKINLQPYFADQAFAIQVAASGSRLNNEKRIEQIFTQRWPQINATAACSLYVRVHTDVCTISVDTSGELLHRRQGSKAASNSGEATNNIGEAAKWIGEAPLRETTAAFLLRCLCAQSTPYDWRQVILWDPMAGSGTLLSEAALLLQPQQKRTFAFQSFPLCPKLLKSPQFFSNYVSFTEGFTKLWASDKDPQILEVIQHNLSISLPPQNMSQVQVFAQDVFAALPASFQQKLRTQKLWILSNPPYGDRISLSQKKQDPYQLLALQLAKYQPERLGLLLPPEKMQVVQQTLQQQTGLQLHSVQRFKNGGKPVQFVVFHAVEKNNPAANESAPTEPLEQ